MPSQLSLTKGDQTHTGEEDGNVNMEAEIEVTQPQVQECQQLGEERIHFGYFKPPNVWQFVRAATK